jgi:hypothetical protein
MTRTGSGPARGRCDHEGTTVKLKVEQIGNPRFPRYGISCENGVWWTGTTWTPNRTKAALYAELAVARDDWKKLSKEMESGLTVLTASVVVTVKADSELTTEQIATLKWYLSGSSTFLLDYSQPRPDWLANAVVSSQIVWSSLKKK